MAYAHLGFNYGRSDSALSAEYATKAWLLRDRVTDRDADSARRTAVAMAAPHASPLLVSRRYEPRQSNPRHRALLSDSTQ
jgi:hypothetical protein